MMKHVAPVPASCTPRNTTFRIARFVIESQTQYVLNHKDPRKWGEWIRKELTVMGPAFIKMGQFLSTRTDLFEKSIVSELAKLQDDITPVSTNELHFILDESFGRSWTEVFEAFDDRPLACASIGQVHLATMRGSRRRVVVKIQKPCVAKQIKDDIETLKQLNVMLAAIGSSRAGEIENVLQQYERFLSAELDYRQEMYHMIRFREILEDVRVPRVYKSLCTSQVLVMEYVPSTKINDITALKARGIDTRALADTLINVFLEMIITYGYVHCDPHPGNVGVMDDGETIVLYDFGNVIELSADFRKQVNNLIFAVYQKDVNEFVDILMKLRVFNMTEGDDLDIRLFFQSFFQYLETLDIKTLQQSIRNQELFTSQSTDISKLKVDPDFLALFRVFSLLDGTCSQLDPDFNYINSLEPFTRELFSDVSFFDYRARKDIEKLQSYPKMIQTIEQNVARIQKQVNQTNAATRNTEYFIFACILISQLDHVYSMPLYGLLFIVWRSLT